MTDEEFLKKMEGVENERKTLMKAVESVQSQVAEELLSGHETGLFEPIKLKGDAILILKLKRFLKRLKTALFGH